jgi:hypothetical protein
VDKPYYEAKDPARVYTKGGTQPRVFQVWGCHSKNRRAIRWKSWPDMSAEKRTETLSECVLDLDLVPVQLAPGLLPQGKFVHQ